MNKTKRMILIVDDEEDVREVLELMLGSDYEIFTAENGVDALKVIEENKGIELILSDVRMPVMTGIQFLEEMKKKYPLIPVVVFLTGFSDVNCEEAFDLGARAFLPKSLSRSEIQSTIEKILKNSSLYSPGTKSETVSTLKLECISLENAESSHFLSIGQGGMFVQEVLPVDIGKNVKLEISFKEGECKEIRGVGKIMWKRGADGDKKRGMGIQFIELPLEIENYLMKYVKENNINSFIPKGVK